MAVGVVVVITAGAGWFYPRCRGRWRRRFELCARTRRERQGASLPPVSSNQPVVLCIAMLSVHTYPLFLAPFPRGLYCNLHARRLFAASRYGVGTNTCRVHDTKPPCSTGVGDWDKLQYRWPRWSGGYTQASHHSAKRWLRQDFQGGFHEQVIGR